MILNIFHSDQNSNALDVILFALGLLFCFLTVLPLDTIAWIFALYDFFQILLAPSPSFQFHLAGNLLRLRHLQRRTSVADSLLPLLQHCSRHHCTIVFISLLINFNEGWQLQDIEITKLYEQYKEIVQEYITLMKTESLFMYYVP
uniref:Uncharacterized protein n=1 Tax=Lactuca sativa TaxID=4236 RepID=A0A9R1X208_LACSA|nr:hypothetical protein LSAT_V11C700385370 [Lactuca sativa]